MLKEETVRKVRELLATGTLSQRAISRLTGVSRVVVHRIATGKRKDKVVRTPEEWEDDWSGRPFERCRICGALVRLPCLACIIRKLAAKNRQTLIRTIRPSCIEIDLEEKHRIRYEQVKAWREAQRDPDFVEVPENWPFRKRWKGKKADSVEPYRSSD